MPTGQFWPAEPLDPAPGAGASAAAGLSIPWHTAAGQQGAFLGHTAAGQWREVETEKQQQWVGPSTGSPVTQTDPFQSAAEKCC